MQTEQPLAHTVHLAIANETEQVQNARFTLQTVEELQADHVEFIDCEFSQCTLSACSFRKVSFINCKFTNCNFIQCVFIDAFIKNSQFNACRLERGNFVQSHCKQVKFTDCDLQYANFTQSVWQQCNIVNTGLQHTSLAEMKWQKITVNQVDFTGADFFKTMLKGVDLSTCTLDGIGVSESCAELKGAKIAPLQAVIVAQIVGIKIV